MFAFYALFPLIKIICHLMYLFFYYLNLDVKSLAFHFLNMLINVQPNLFNVLDMEFLYLVSAPAKD